MFNSKIIHHRFIKAWENNNHSDILKCLDEGADINYKYKDPHYSISHPICYYFMSRYNDYSLLPQLIQRKLSLKNNGYKILLKAAENGDLDLIKILQHWGVSLFEKQAEWLKYVILHQHFHCLDYFLDLLKEKKYQKEMTPFILSDIFKNLISQHHTSLVKNIFEKFKQDSFLFQQIFHPDYTFSDYTHVPLLPYIETAIRSNNIESLDFLLHDNSWNVSLDLLYLHVFSYAAHQGSESVLEYIWQHGKVFTLEEISHPSSALVPFYENCLVDYDPFTPQIKEFIQAFLLKQQFKENLEKHLKPQQQQSSLLKI